MQIDPQAIRAVRAASSPDELHHWLEQAVVLEHTTIPPYLTAMYTLKPSNAEIAGIIRSVVVEEMLHMTIAANVLIAIGGRPSINRPGFVPSYPDGPLPMDIGGKDFKIPIQQFSLQLVHDVFMTIEEPDHEPVVTALAAVEEPATIGTFYEAIQNKIRELGPSIFTVGPEQQVLTMFDPKRLFPIVDPESACAALQVIVVEGEGTTSSPFDSPGELAHYYKFGEIYHGKRVVKDGDGYTYGGAPVPFDANGVHEMPADPSIDSFPAGSQARVMAQRFASIYSKLLNGLHESFNGSPETIRSAIGLMYSLRLQAEKTLTTRTPTGGFAGLSYEYVPAEELFAGVPSGR